MKRYAEYKDSGVKWLGKIPSHWEVKKIKYVFRERSQKGFPNEPVLCATQKYGVIPQSMYENRVVTVNKGLEGLKLVREGDFVISLRSFQGGIEYAHYQGIISAAYTILSLVEDASAQYIKHLFKSVSFIELLKMCVTGIREGQNINYDVLRENYIVLPPIEEQAQIAHYLKVKTSKIDKYVTKREREREQFESLKQAEISNVVTKGLNPDVPMKDSGIPWLGMIPEHWEVKMLSQLCKEHFVSNKNIHNQNLLSLSYGHIVNKDINTTDGLLPASFDTYQIIERGNIVLRLTDLQNDHKSLRVGLSKQEGIITSAYICLEVMKYVLPDYLYYLLHTADLKKMFYSMGNGLRQNLNWMELRKFRAVLPPLEEQQAIVEYIDSRIEKIDRYIAGLTAEIEYLKEFKQRLISDAVTGQIKVTD